MMGVSGVTRGMITNSTETELVSMLTRMICVNARV
jgi:hypothetical protein